MRTSHKLIGEHIGKAHEQVEVYEHAIEALGDEALIAGMVAYSLRVARYENTRLPMPAGPNELRDTVITVLKEDLRRAKLRLKEEGNEWGTYLHER